MCFIIIELIESKLNNEFDGRVSHIFINTIMVLNIETETTNKFYIP